MSIRGLHCWAPSKDQVGECEKFIREVLPAEGINVLIIQFNYFYQFESHPEIGGGNACGKAEVKRLLAACRQSGIKLVPQMNCLGHQRMGWAPRAKTLLQAYPEFDETPNLVPPRKGPQSIKCYCPRHPKVHSVLFDLIDELAEACEADAFHVGMDEVFQIAHKDCPRCGGADPAEVFAEEVSRLHDHLAARGRTMWMWGDRLINAEAAGTNLWEGSANGTHPAVDNIPEDIVICDWHYRKAFQTPAYFIDKGFRVLACPWNNKDVALGQLKMMRQLAADADRAKAGRALGMVQTTWTSLYSFARAYRDPSFREGRYRTRLDCFKTLSAELRDVRK